MATQSPQQIPRSERGSTASARPERGPDAASRAAPFESSAALVLVLDTGEKLLHASSSWKEIFGEPCPVLGRPLLDSLRSGAFSPGELGSGDPGPGELGTADRELLLDGLEATLRDRSIAPILLRHRDPQRGSRRLEGHAYFTADQILLVFHDVTERYEAIAHAIEGERRELEERIRRTEKLESLGVLAAGIAHDFNNLLTPIVGNASLLLADLPEDAPVRRWAQAIRTGADRATALTARMLAYAGRTSRQVTLLDVSTIIQEISLLLETTASSASRVQCDLSQALPRIHGDAAQITQIAVNLVANASEALGSDGGRIDIRTGCIRATRADLAACHLGESCREGEYVFIEVRDDADGLAAEARDRLIDPFFSTKAAGRGLGLSVVIGAVRAHEGALAIESDDGGTCFRVLLPAHREDGAGSRAGASLAHPDPSAPRPR